MVQKLAHRRSLPYNTRSSRHSRSSAPPPTATPSLKTYIPKLLDRPVDVARLHLDEEPPLYEMSRAWVHGKINERATSSSPASNYERPTESTTDVHNLEPPKSKEEILKQLGIETNDCNFDLRIPQSVREFEPSKDIVDRLDRDISSMDPSDCLEANKRRWRRVKDDWSAARRIHELRYEESFKVLDEIFISSQRPV